MISFRDSIYLDSLFGSSGGGVAAGPAWIYEEGPGDNFHPGWTGVFAKIVRGRAWANAGAPNMNTIMTALHTGNNPFTGPSASPLAAQKTSLTLRITLSPSGRREYLPVTGVTGYPRLSRPAG